MKPKFGDEKLPWKQWHTSQILKSYAWLCFVVCMTVALLMCKPLRLVMPVVKNLPANTGDIRDVGSIPGSGRSPGGGRGNPLQYSCLENSMDRGAWQATVHGVAKSRTRLSDSHTHTHTHNMYKIDKQQGLLYSTGSNTQYLITTYKGEESEINIYCCCCLVNKSWLTLLWPSGL